MSDKDIKLVREQYSTLRDLVIRNPGGWDDGDSRAKVERACEAAKAALADAECHERLRAVETQARDLYSAENHARWARRNMSGADYLRLQILIALEAVNTRLFFIDTMRARSLLDGGHASEAGLAAAQGGRQGLV
jgi:hypothetical protein